MNNQHNWLDIQEQLYPETYIQKILHVQGQLIDGPINFPIQVIYNSLHREVNVTEPIGDLIANFFQIGAIYQIFMFDNQEQKFKNVGSYPFKSPILLKGAFVHSQVLVIKLQKQQQLNNNSKSKPKTDKTLKYVLQKVAQWRKIHMESQKKITLEQAANMIQIARSTLDDYYFHIKLAEKYGFNFQQYLEKPFHNLRKFVKQNEQKKQKSKNPSPLPNILSKYQPK